MWPACWPAFNLFLRVQSQWRTGMAGVTGLDYVALYPLIDRMNLDQREWDEVFDDVRAMEAAAIEQMRENQPSH